MLRFVACAARRSALTQLEAHETKHNRARKQAAVAIARGTRLPRPSAELVPDSMWLLLTRCWRAAPAERPTTDKLIADLSAILADDARK